MRRKQEWTGKRHRGIDMKKLEPITSDSPFFDKKKHQRNLKVIERHHSFKIEGIGDPFMTMEGCALFLDEPFRARFDEITADLEKQAKNKEY